MCDNLKQYRRDLDRELRRVELAASLTMYRRCVLRPLGRLYDLTPVDEGNTRSNWQLLLPGETAVEIKRPGTVSKATILGVAAPKIAIAAATMSDVVIANPSPVAVILDRGLFDPPDPGPSKDPRPGRKGRILVKGGFSTQAPQGMTAIVVAELAGIAFR